MFHINTGLLDVDDSISDDIETDEVLAELQKRQAELRALSSHNRNQKNRLMRLAKEEMKRQELKQKMRTADNEVCENIRVECALSRVLARIENLPVQKI